MAVRIALEGAQEAGAETRLLDLRDYDLPFSSGNPKDRNYPPDVYRLREDIQSADGVILVDWATKRAGQSLSERDLKLGAPIEVDGQVVGWLLYNEIVGPWAPGTIEWDFISKIRIAIWFSAGGAKYPTTRCWTTPSGSMMNVVGMPWMPPKTRRCSAVALPTG